AATAPEIINAGKLATAEFDWYGYRLFRRQLPGIYYFRCRCLICGRERGKSYRCETAGLSGYRGIVRAGIGRIGVQLQRAAWHPGGRCGGFSAGVTGMVVGNAER